MKHKVKNEIEHKFSQRLKELRNERGLGYKEFSEFMEISQGTLALWESGGETNFSMLVKIARYFGVSVGYLLGEEDV